MGTLTIYSDPAPNGTFGDPGSFRDGTPVLVAAVQQQLILDTVNGTFTAQDLNTITSASPFAGPDGGLLFGRAGDRSRSIITGRTYPSGPPVGFFAGYAYSLGRAHERAGRH